MIHCGAGTGLANHLAGMQDALATAALGPILVVDDDESIVRVLCRLIGKVCPAVGATTIVDANRHIEQSARLTGLILDVHLREGSGWEILVTARARDPLLPAMMLTGMRWSSLVEQASEFHAIPYEKPLEPGDAVRFAESARRLQENARTRMRDLVQELAERCHLSTDEVSAVEATLFGQNIDPTTAPSNTRPPHGAPKTQTAHILGKTGAKSLRDVRDSLLRAYFAS
jgi:CheY-like chemotaxis protein